MKAADVNHPLFFFSATGKGTGAGVADKFPGQNMQILVHIVRFLLAA